MRNLKLILKIYNHLPERLQKNEKLISFLYPRIERELAEVKQDVIRAKWEKIRVEQQLEELKHN